MFNTFRKEDGRIRCLICPHECLLKDGSTGICGVRKNTDGINTLTTYGIISSMAADPVEKKPLYHFFPGSKILSIGSWGCNLKCNFCQNYSISQFTGQLNKTQISPDEIVQEAMHVKSNIGVAYTYNEPVIWYEFVRDTAELMAVNGFKNVLVTNGFVSEGALDEYIRFIDAFNIDLKAFNETFYRKETGSSLDPVRKSILKTARSGRHLEITTLIITGLNDSKEDFREEVKWISGELGPEIPLHISRYFPMHMQSAPSTDPVIIEELFGIAHEYLKYVYTGNYSNDISSTTICPQCGNIITSRKGYQVKHTGTADGACNRCGRNIYRNFTFSS